MKKIAAVIMGAALLLTAGCFGGEDPAPGPEPDENAVIASEIVKNADGTETFCVGGEPFLYLGAEARFEAYTNCDETPSSDYGKYVKRAAELGFNVLAVSVDWADIEPEEGKYDFTVINNILRFGEQYGIKIELLWYSALMCGDSHEWHLPAYIFNETPCYTMHSENGGVEQPYITDSTIYGIQKFLKISDPTFMKREAAVVKALMEHIYMWEEARSFPKVLIGVQVYNEADAFPEKRVDQYDVCENGKRLTNDQAWEVVLTAMENCAKAFKSSRYKVITRTNLLRPDCIDLQWPGYSPIARAKEVFALPHLDAVGYDPYLNSPTELKASIEYYQRELPENFTHIAENGRKTSQGSGEGTYENGEGEILTAVSLNCGYMLYELCSPKFFDKSGYPQGIIDPYTLEDYSYTPRIASMCNALRKVSSVAASTAPEDFAAFNIDTASGRENWSKKIVAGGVEFSFSTNAGAKGFAIVKDGYIYLYSSAAAEVTLGNGTFEGAEYGGFEGGAWKTEGSEPLSENKLTPAEGRVYRVKIASLAGELASTANTFKG